MRKSHLLLISLLSLPVFSQIGLSVHLKRSHSERSITSIVDSLTIYKDNIFFKNIPHPDSFALYERVPTGKYTFCYTNLFREKIKKTITLNEANNKLGGQEVDLYIDQLQKPKSTNLFIHNLKNNDRLTIHLKFSGCFSNGVDSIAVYKKNNHFFLKYKKRERKLKKSDIEAIVKYETELRSLPEVNFISTSNGWNEIILNEEKFTYLEPSLFWGGYEILKKSLELE